MAFKIRFGKYFRYIIQSHFLKPFFLTVSFEIFSFYFAVSAPSHDGAFS